MAQSFRPCQTAQGHSNAANATLGVAGSETLDTRRLGNRVETWRTHCKMEVYDQAEAFSEKDGDLEFSHTKAILRQGDQFFYCISQRRHSPGSTVDLLPSDLHEIPQDIIWPKVDLELTEAPRPLPLDSYIKQPRLIEYGDTEAALNPGAQLLHEATIWEVLYKSPHPNIARFLGCIIKDGRLTGLCFVKYPMNLFEAARSSNSLDIQRCLLGIESGVRHLHRLGFIHNDLNPSNIMMDGDTPVIIDLDSCEQEGAMLRLKAGTVGWSACDSEVAERKNDLDALPKIQNYLEETRKTHGNT
ncbi:hypothetical protein GGI42DRAFT_315683 [Trichoderma sp. SZMC 28013]